MWNSEEESERKKLLFGRNFDDARHRLWYNSPDETQAKIRSAAESPFVTLSQAKQITNMGAFPVDVVFQLFGEFAEDDGFVTMKGFEQCFQILVDASDFDDER